MGMTTTVLPAPSAPARSSEESLVTCGYGGLAVAASCMLGLHVAAWREVNPRLDVMSMYALVDGVGWLFGVMLAGVVVATLSAAVLLRRAGVSGLILFGLTLAGAGAWLAGAFPTTAGEELDMAAELHRYGALTMMCSVPIVGLLAARRLDNRLLGMSSLVTAAVLSVSLLSHVEVMPQVLLDVKGLLQRGSLAGVVVVLAQLLALQTRKHRPATPRLS